MSQSMGQTVDSKVVEMSFNNQNFEQNAKQSIQTLKQLKEGLNLDGAAKGFENIDKAAKNISFDAIASGIEHLEKRFSAFGIAGMAVIQNLTNRAMSMVDNVIGKATALPSKAWNLITEGGKARAMGIENSRFMLQGLFPDDLSEVERIMDDAMDSVDGTAYAFDSAAQAASQFAASGLKSGESMQKALKAVTGVAAMTNSEYESISQIFTTVAGNGKLMGDQLLQLSGRGLNAASTLATFFNDVKSGSEKTKDVSEDVKKKIEELAGSADVTEADIREFVSDSKISFDIFSEAMSSAFGEHAKKANETLTGSLANMKAALKKIGAKFYTPLVEQNGPLVEMFNEVRLKINEVNKAIDPLVNLLSSGVIKGIETLTGLVKGLDFQHSGFKAFLDALAPKKVSIDDIFDLPGLKGLNKEADTTSGKLKLLNDTQQELVSRPEKIKALEAVFIATARSHGVAIDDMIAKEGSFAGALRKNNFLTADMYNEALNSIGEITKGIVEGTGEASVKSEEDLAKIREAALAVIRGDYGNDMDARFAKLEEEGFDPQRVQDYVNALHKAAGGTWDLTDAAYEAADAAIGAGTSIEKMSDEQLASAGYTEDQIKALRALQAEAEAAGMTLQEYLGVEGITDTKSGAELLLDSLQNAITGMSKVFGSIGSAWSEVFPTATTDVIYSVIKGINNFSKGLIISDSSAAKVKDTFSGLFSVVDILARTFKAVAGPAITAAVGGFRLLAKVMLNILAPIGRFVTAIDGFFKEIGLFDKISSGLTKVFSTIGGAVNSLVDTVGGVGTRAFKSFAFALKSGDIKNVGAAFKLALGDINDQLKKVGINFEPAVKIIGSGIDAITKFAGKAIGPIKSFGVAVGGFVTKSFQRFTKVFTSGDFTKIGAAFKLTINDISGRLKKAGVNIYPFIDKVSAGFGKLKDSVFKITAPFKTFGNTIATTVATKFKGFGEHLVNTGTRFQEFLARVKEIGGLKFKNLGTIFSDLKTNVLGFFTDFSGFTAIKDGFIQLFEDVKNTIVNFFSSTDIIGMVGDAVTGAWDTVSSSIANFFEGSGIFDTIVNKFKSFGIDIKPAMETVTGLFEKLPGSVKRFAETVGGVAQRAAKRFTKAFASRDFTKVGNAVKNTFRDIKNRIKEAGLNLDPFIKTISKGFTSVGTTVKSAGGKIAAFTKKAFKEIKAIPGLAEGFNKLKISAKTLFTGMIPHLTATKGKIGEFVEKVKTMGGIRLDNLGEVFHNFKTMVVDYFTNFEGFSAIKDAFSNIGKSIGDAMGRWLDGSSIGKKLLGVKDKIVSVFKNIGPSISNGIVGIKEFIDRTKDALSKGFSLQNIGKVFEDLKTSVGTAIDGFFGDGGLGKNIGDSVSGIWDTLKSKFSGLEIIDKIKEKITGFIDGIKSIFGDFELPSSFSELFGMVTEAAEVVYENIDSAEESEEASETWGGKIKKIITTLGEVATFVKDNIGPVVSGIAGVIAFIKIAGLISGISKFLKGSAAEKKGEGFKRFATGVLIFAGAVWVMVQAVKSFEKSDPAAAIGGLIAVGAIVGMLIGLEASSKHFKKGQKTIVSLALFLGTLAAALFVVSIIPTKKLATVTIAIGAIIGICALLAIAAKSAKKANKTIGVMIGLIAVIGIVLGLLASLVDPDSLIKTAESLGGLLLALTIAMVILSKIKAVNMGAMLQVAAVVGVMTVVVAIVAGLLATLVDPDALTKTAKSLGGLLLALAAAMFILSNIRFVDMTAILQVAAVIGIIVVVVGLVAGIVGALDMLTGGGVGDAIKRGMELLGDICEGIGNAIGRLAGGLVGSGAEEAMSHLPAIGDSIVAFMESLQPLSSMGEVDFGPVIAALLTVAGASFVGALDGVASIVTELTTGMSAVELVAHDLELLSEALVKWSEAMDKIGPDGIEVDGSGLAELGVAIAGYAGLGLVEGIASIIPELLEGTSAIGLVCQDLESLAAALLTWEEAMDKIGTDGITVDGSGLAALALVYTGYTGLGLVGSITSILPELLEGTSAVGLVSQDLELLAQAITKWEEAMDKIGTDGITVDGSGLGELAIVYTGYTGLGLVGGITSILPELLEGTSAVGLVSQDLENLAQAITTWQTAMTKISTDGIEVDGSGLGELAMVYAGYTGLGLASSITSIIPELLEGTSAVGLVSQDITLLAEALSAWQTEMNKIGPDGITVDGSGINSLAGLITDINIKGVYSAITEKIGEFVIGEDGEGPMDKFSENVGKLADGIVTWNEKTAGLKIDPATITAIQDLEASIKELPVGGLIGALADFFTGSDEEKIATFKTDVEKLGEALTAFDNSLGGDIDVEKVQKLAKASESLGMLAQALAGIEQLGVFATMESFGSSLVTYGTHLATFAATDIDLASLESLAKSSSSLSLMASRVNSMKFDGDFTNESLFNSFKDNITALADLFSGLTSLDTSGVDKLVDGVNKVNAADLSGAATKANLMLKNEAKKEAGSAGSDSGEAYAKGMESAKGDAANAASNLASATSAALSDTNSFRQAGLNMMGAVAGGIYTAMSVVTTAASSVASTAASTLSAVDTYTSGYNFNQGFANGINAYSYIAEAAARSLGAKALENLKAAIKQGSPSRETYKSGHWFVMGMLKGITDYTKYAAYAASDLGEAALDSLNDTVGAISSLFSQEIDAQPVITPVLDLTEIQNGALTMGNMLALNDPISVTGNMSAISANMYNRGATNDDLLYALGSLKRTLEANPREANTYIVDGVTYDDGSNITDAVRTLVNATVVRQRS